MRIFGEPGRAGVAARWRAPFYLLVGCLVLGLIAPRLALRVYLTACDEFREGHLAWARWIAGRHGVPMLSSGPAEAGAPTICLTFDDGPHPRTCTAILDVLRREHVPATFFVVGTRSREHPELLRRMLREGHEIGNHTWDHQRLTTLEPDEVRWELRGLHDLIVRCTGIWPTLCRPPGGTYDARVLEICRDEGYRVCLWSVNAGDWITGKTADQIAERVIDRVRPGAIVLLHDEKPATPEALPWIIHALRERGYQFLTVSEMLPAIPPACPVGMAARLDHG
jgi:peptidoglycan/xylan/chitin deacetylase (PgdA/CDA1 family)